jgi:broad specificity phosphatase PhoE
MIHQDVLMRQIRQFTKAIATLLSQAPREQADDVLREIDEACRAHLDGRAADLRTAPPEALLEMCHEGDRFVPDAAQSLAQTLQRMGEAHREREEPERAGACFGRSLLLYRRLLSDPEAPVSWKVGTTVAALSDRVEQFPVDDATADALDALRNGTE